MYWELLKLNTNGYLESHNRVVWVIVESLYWYIYRHNWPSGNFSEASRKTCGWHDHESFRPTTIRLYELYGVLQSLVEKRTIFMRYTNDKEVIYLHRKTRALSLTLWRRKCWSIILSLLLYNSPESSLRLEIVFAWQSEPLFSGIIYNQGFFPCFEQDLGKVFLIWGIHQNSCVLFFIQLVKGR